MDKNNDLKDINKQLERPERAVPLWIFFLIAAFIVGFIFRYTLADLISSKTDNKKNEDKQTIVWQEPETIIYKDDNSGKLGDDLKDHSVILDGTYYYLPCPIYEFVENGWSIDIAGNNSKTIVYEVPKGTIKIVSMSRDGNDVKVVSVASPNGETVSISESFVTGFTIFSWSNVEIELPQNVKIGMDRNSLEKIIKENNLSYDKDLLKEKDIYDIKIDLEDEKYDRYEIRINMKNDKIDQIRVEVMYSK